MEGCRSRNTFGTHLMSISRIEKAIFEATDLPSLEAARKVRAHDVEILCGADFASLPVMAAASTALLLRCFTGKIILGFAAETSTRMKEKVLEACQVQASRYNASQRLRVEGGAAYSLGLGTPVHRGTYVDASGWCAGVNALFSEHGPFVTPAAHFAVSAGVAKLFNAAVLADAKDLDEKWTFSLWSFSSDCSERGRTAEKGFRLPRSGLIGAGAIGSAFGFIIESLQWPIMLDVIDFDSYEEPNEETTLILGPEVARKTPRKAQYFSDVISSADLKINPLFEKVSSGSKILRAGYELFICAVDNADTRRELDGQNAKVMINAAVGGSGADAGWCLWSRHGESDPVLSKGYPNVAAESFADSKVPNEFSNDECSRKNYRGVALAVPFVALAAGSLIAASCAHQAFGHETACNKITIDLLRKQRKFGTFRRTR